MSTGGSYDPRQIEHDIYAFWEKGGHFNARVDPSRRPYVIDIPLPNITGALHMGHALNNTVQDTLIRYHRMRGFEALWMPGTDHAGIATQAVVERKLREEQGITRHELGREGLVKKIWEWKEDYGGRILNQLRALGASCDWPRARFTLDEVCAKAVYEVFFQWFQAGLIFRGRRLVNWDAFLQTAVADDEVIYETVKGHFWHFRYPILEAGGGHEGAGGPASGRSFRSMETVPADLAAAAIARATREGAQLGVDYMAIATTRPETMLGDVALCVHPSDPRYQNVIGKHVLLPLMNRAIPIIADAQLAKMELGTGCVKVTPGHDPKDYQCGLRNNLPMVNILTPDGKINEHGRGAGEERHEGTEARRHEGESAGDAAAGRMSYSYVGLPKEEARKRVVADLEALGLVEKIEDYQTEVGHSDRSKTPIEPMLSEQWFVKMSDPRLAERALEAVRDGRVTFYPERYAKTYLDWLGEKRDWCISRQLWWGHRIPVWRRRFTLTEKNWTTELLGNGIDSLLAGKWSEPHDIFVRITRSSDGALIEDAAQRFNPVTRADEGEYEFAVCLRNPADKGAAKRLEDAGFTQDPDVLDTWFSSALWPFSTLGWPDDYGKARRHEAAQARSAAASPASVPSPTDLAYFYPTSVLVTARDIITLWVARMVVTGLYFHGRVPFQHVHIHPNIQDAQGRRMNKSLGNGVDPLDIINKFGTDALRFTMVQIDSETQDARLPVMYSCPHCNESFAQANEHLGKPVVKCRHCKKEFATRLASDEQIKKLGLGVVFSDRVELARNFCNKIWQAATGFVLPNLGERAEGGPALHPSVPQPLNPSSLAVEDRWILSRLAHAIERIDARYARYQMSDIANTLYDFFWSDFCDWYVELVKPRLFAGEKHDGTDARTHEGAGSADTARRVLATVLDTSLRLMHPIMPFISEALWRRLNAVAPQRGITTIVTGEPALIRAAWPDAASLPHDDQVEREIAALQEVIRALRDTLARINQARSADKQPAIGKLPRAVLRVDATIAAGLQAQTAVLERLGRCESVEVGVDVAKPADSSTQVLSGVEVYVPLAGLMDLGAERTRLAKERDELRGHIDRARAKLGNEGFVAKAPPAVIESERARVADMETRLAVIERNLADIAH